jgi:hypothetical protein
MRILVAAISLLVLARPCSAQRVIGRVVDTDSGQPVHGAFVSLLDPDNRRLSAVLSDTAGRFLLTAPAAGVYRLRSERIGQKTVLTDTIRLELNTTMSVTIRSPSQAILLAGLSAQGSKRCSVRAEAAAGAAQLWEEVRKALDITRWTSENTTVLFRSSVYMRILEPQSLRVLSQEVHGHAGSGQRTFTTQDPAELARYGYVRLGDDRSLYFYGLDAQLLLSDVFLDEHCFEVVDGRGADTGLVGLHFRPLRDGFQPDVEGTLWVDRASAELRRIDYKYVRANRLVPTSEATGQTRFRRLPSGFWVVDSWYIRAPQLTRSGSRYTVQSFREHGGVVLSIRDNTNTRIVADVQLAGTVVDAVRGVPLRGASVSLLATDRAVTTDSLGAFHLLAIEAGNYDLALSHPRLDTIPLVQGVRRVLLEADASSPLVLATPSFQQIADSICPRAARNDAAPDAGILWGYVRTPDTTAVPGARIEAAWTTPPTPEHAAGARAQTVSVMTDAQGRYVLCSAPVAVAMQVTMRFRNIRSTAQVAVPPRDFARRDFTAIADNRQPH